MFSRKQLIKLMAPLIVEQIMTVLVGMVDVMMVAAVGETAVSGVALVDSISILILQIMGALATGGAVISAQYLGKSEPRNARKAAGQLVMITLALSLAVTSVALIGNRRLLSGIFGQVETTVMDNAETYFWITALSYPFIGLYNACAALFRSMGNSKVSMMTSLVMNIVNIAGNAVCVFGLKMGVAGVAWPTLFLYRKFLKSREIVYNEVEIKNCITKERRCCFATTLIMKFFVLLLAALFND